VVWPQAVLAASVSDARNAAAAAHRRAFLGMVDPRDPPPLQWSRAASFIVCRMTVP